MLRTQMCLAEDQCSCQGGTVPPLLQTDALSLSHLLDVSGCLSLSLSNYPQISRHCLQVVGQGQGQTMSLCFQCGIPDQTSGGKSFSWL